MKTITLKQFRDDPEELIRQPAEVAHGEILLDEEFIGIDEQGIVQLVYIKLPECKETEMYKALVKKLKYSSTIRSSGISTTSTIFGFSPPRNMRGQYYCSSTIIANTQKKENAFLAWYCEKFINPLFNEYYAHNLSEHMEAIKNVRPEWLMNGTFFTGGVINKSNQLNYHIDQQNMKGSINAMVYFTRDMEGGELVLPKYNARLKPLDKHVLLFRNDLVHGVAPLTELNQYSYRYSIVYYCNAGMDKCGTFDEELVKAREEKNPVFKVKRQLMKAHEDFKLPTDLLVCVISHNRAEVLPENYDKNEWIYIVGKGEIEAYQAVGCKHVIEGGGLIESRNKALELGDERNMFVLQLSDDLGRCMIGEKEVSPHEVIEHAYKIMKGRDIALIGVNPVFNTFYQRDTVTNGFVIGDFTMTKPHTGIRYDNKIRLKEDYDFSLQYLKKYRHALRLNNVLCEFKHYANKGGAVDYRTDEREAETVKYLTEKWGEVLQANTRRKSKNELLIKRNWEKLI